MEVIIIVVIAIGLYWFFSQSTSNPSRHPKKISTQIPEEVIVIEFIDLRRMFVDGEMANKMTTDLILKRANI